MRDPGWSRLTVVGFVVLVTAVPIVAMIALGVFDAGAVTGELSGSGPLLGELNFQADACCSGQPDGFLGVYVGSTGRSDARLKAFEDPIHGSLVLLQVPGSCEGPRCKQVMLSAETCAQFAVRIRRTNTTINDVRVLEGELRLDCALASGDRIVGGLHFEGCH
jgi:hypothetical protein